MQKSMQKILITSFDTWLPHQKSNSADDLLKLLLEPSLEPSLEPLLEPFLELMHPIPTLDLEPLRHLPVDINRSTKAVITAITKFSPRAIICCGMAENRKNLAIEVQAFPPFPSSSSLNKPLTTTVDLAQITQGLTTTTLSYDAGKFVCEGLYYEILRYLSKFSPPLPCIFIHVPPLTRENQSAIAAEFSLILKNLANSDKINRDQQKNYI